MVTNYDVWNRLHFDGVEGYLSRQLETSDNTMDITAPLRHDGGILLPTFETEQYLPITILDSNYVLKEIVYLYEHQQGQTTLKIDRAKEGTDSSAPLPKGNKVVHAPTSEDFLSILKHNNDSTAHGKLIKDLIDAAIKVAMDAHLAALNPHPQYALLGDGTGTTIFDNDVVFNKNVTVKGTLLIPKGATLKVEGTIRVETPSGTVDGLAYIHGKQLIISDAEPSGAMLNTVWIQTFGA